MQCEEIRSMKQDIDSVVALGINLNKAFPTALIGISITHVWVHADQGVPDGGMQNCPGDEAQLH